MVWTSELRGDFTDLKTKLWYNWVHKKSGIRCFWHIKRWPQKSLICVKKKTCQWYSKNPDTMLIMMTMLCKQELIYFWQGLSTFGKILTRGNERNVHVPIFLINFFIRRKVTATVTQQIVHLIQGLITILKMGVTHQEWNILEFYQLLIWRIT